MAKRVVKDVKIEVKAGGDFGAWQDISDHVESVEYDFSVGEVAKCRLTIHCDPDVLRVSRLPI